MKTSDMVVTLSLDTTLLNVKIKQLTDLIKSRFPEGVPEGIDSQLTSLSNDIVFIDGPSTVKTTGINQIVQRVDFGFSFDALTAAIRAGNFDFHKSSSSDVGIKH
ncbi:hypothetical protein [Yersinia alsatica]|uniref:hypothetical protein n=1 Tax=Yersinia alsatica TaxID=2890317 RepID=UPI0011A178A1|nr:hypothetical protein [Yersinia alsatica]